MTAQIPEWIIIDGEQTTMAFCPPLPADEPRVIIRKVNQYTELDNDSTLRSTGCWRHYVGSWEIRDGALYLIGIRGRYALLGDEPLLADWVNATLRITDGEMLTYVPPQSADVAADASGDEAAPVKPAEPLAAPLRSFPWISARDPA